jgi:hypothetical protein
LFADVAAFAVRLEALLSPSLTSAAQATAPAMGPSSSTSVTEDVAPAPETGDGRDAAPNPLEDTHPKANPLSPVPPISDSVSPVRNAHTAHPGRMHPRDNTTASPASRRHSALQEQAVQAAANFAPQPAIPIDTPPLEHAHMSAPDLLAASLIGGGQPNPIQTQPLWSDETAAANSDGSPRIDVTPPPGASVSQLAAIENLRPFATGTPAALTTHETETTRPTNSGAPVFYTAASPIPDPIPHSPSLPGSAPVDPAALHEAPISDTAMQPPAQAATAANKIDASDPAAQPQAAPAEPVSSNRLRASAPQPAALPGEVTSAVQSAGAQFAASTNVKTQPAAFRSLPHATDPGPVLNVFPAPVSAPPTADAHSAQPAPATTAFFSPQSTFAALDTPTPSPSTLFTHAGLRHAEAGYLDPSLGWVGVRAEVSSGALHAAVLPASPQAADILGAHLPALHTYVSQQHGIESTIDMSWQNNTNAGGGFQQSSHQDPYPSAGDDPAASVPRPAPASVSPPGSFASFDAAGAPPPASGGRYISVLA